MDAECARWLLRRLDFDPGVAIVLARIRWTSDPIPTCSGSNRRVTQRVAGRPAVLDNPTADE